MIESDEYILHVAGIIMSCLWFIGVTIYVIINWKSKDMDNGSIVLWYLVGTPIIGLAGPAILMFLIPVCVFYIIPSMLLGAIRSKYTNKD